ncbi:MAG TPA: sigma 54-interacting transcriptional regulator [archaeon]|nr:sigma 54-interacting transcriptional regulator [archaeon]
MIQKSLSALIILIIFVFANSAFSEKYPFKTYSIDDGLPASLVLSILQDQEGYIWFGTTSGIGKFDGLTFTSYTTADGLANNTVWSMIEDRKGNLWFGTLGGGLSKFDGKKWTTYKTEDGLAYNMVKTMIEDSKGNLWFGTRGGGVSKFDGTSWTTYTTNEGLAGNTVHALIEDKNGNLWFGTDKGLSKFDGEKWVDMTESIDMSIVRSILEDSQQNIWLAGSRKVESLEKPIIIKMAVKPDRADLSVFSERDGLPPAMVQTMLEDRKGNIWFGTYQAGAGMFNGKDWKIYTTENGLPADNIFSLYEDIEGNIWFGTGGGAVKFNGPVFTIYTTDDGLATNALNPVFEDSKGNIWFGSFQNGASRFDGKNWTNYTTEDGLGENWVNKVFEDRKGNIWFGTFGGGVSCFDGINWNTYREIDGLANNKVTSILEDKKENLWFKTNGGVSKYDGTNWTTYTTDQGLTQNDIWTMIEDSAGNIWIGGNEGVNKFDGEKWSTYSTKDSVLLNAVLEIVEGKKGNLWFGTKGGGLTRFDGVKWMSYTTKNGLAHNDIMAIFEDSYGNLWLGTNGGGASKFDGTTFTNYTTKDGLSSNICNFIFQDNGYYYFGTNKGLNRFDGKLFQVFTTKNGLAYSELNEYLKDSKGNYWFGSVNGITKYSPKAYNPNPIPPPVYINRLRTFEKDTPLTSSLVLNYDQNNLRVNYIGICLSAPEDLVYHYKLEGLDSDWIETREHSASYTYIPPGEYTFKVKARNNNGVWSVRSSTISIVVHPPFWATNWFRGAAITVVLLMLWGVYEVKTRSMKRRNEELSREISERKRAEEALLNAMAEVERLKGRLEAENIYLQEEIKIEHNFEEIVSRSEALNKVLGKVEQVTSTDATVLILGETGTGKELVARAVHNISARRDRPLVKVNCSALQANLIESELFGHEKGAFTGAHSRKIGRFELADSGTIFLDEIGDLPLELQAKLLRVLQEGEFERLGSSHTIKVDVRVIAATNRNLEKAIENGDFREDLFYRLNVFPIEIPPLRKHKDDIPLLVNHFVMKYGAKIGKKIDTVPQLVMDTLQAYHWPGNVRELENVIERAVIVSRGNQLELGEWLPRTVSSPVGSHSTTLEEREREQIIEALELTGWRVSGEKGAAKILGIKPTTLDSRIKKLSIKRKR